VSRPQHYQAVRLRWIPAVLGLGVAIALAGCSAGQTAQTQSEVAAVSGGSGDVQTIAVRNAVFTFPTGRSFYPAGATLPLSAVLINSGGQADRLVRVTSTYATSAQVSGNTNLPGGTSLIATGALPSNLRPTTSPQLAPGATTSPATSPTAPTAGATTTSPTATTTSALPSDSIAPPVPAAPPTGPSGEPTVTIALTGVKQTITPGVTIPVTFVFERAGAVTVQVPIGEDPSPRTGSAGQQ
jgi:copper(I)-binding protein